MSSRSLLLGWRRSSTAGSRESHENLEVILQQYQYFANPEVEETHVYHPL